MRDLSGQIERRWRDAYDHREQSEPVELVSFLVHPGGTPISDKYGTVPGSYTANRTMAVVIRPTGQFATYPVDQLWSRPLPENREEPSR